MNLEIFSLLLNNLVFSFEKNEKSILLSAAASVKINDVTDESVLSKVKYD